MGKFLFAIISFCIISCSSKENQESNIISADTSVADDSIVFDTALPDSTFQSDARGDFNGDGIFDLATVEVTENGSLENAEPWIYTIKFTSNIPSLSFISYTEGYALINEGNLNDSPGDELSVRTQGNAMNRAFLQPYTLYNGAWSQAMEVVDTQNVVYPQNMPDGLDSLSAQQLVFKEDNMVYYYKYMESEDPVNGDDAFYQKTQAKLFTAVKPPERIYKR